MHVDLCICRATSSRNIIDWNINAKRTESGFDIAIDAAKRCALFSVTRTLNIQLGGNAG